MAVGLSYEQMMKIPFIIGLIKRYHSPGNTLSQYYGLGVTATAVKQILGITGQYDIFDGTRSLTYMTAPGAPFVRLNRKPIASQPITVPRIAHSIGIEDGKIFGTRSLGMNQVSPVDTGGQQYFTNQVMYAKTRMNNLIEYMSARMFQGGFGMAPISTGSQLLGVTDLDAVGNVVNNRSLIPAGHLVQIGGIIDTSWDNYGADVNGQLMTLQTQAARVNGRRITNVWLNGNTAKHLFNNQMIQAIGGSVYKIFDTLTPSKEIAPGQKFPDTGTTVIFRALPDYKFHIYNQGYVNPGTAEDFASQTSATNWKYFIPNDFAIFTPDPGDWCGMVEGSEPMQWNLLESGSQTIYGFGMGKERTINPPATEVKMLYNGAPVITEPFSCYYAKVIFTGTPA